MGWFKNIDNVPRGHYGAILCDPPWRYVTWSKKGEGKSASQKYQVMSFDAIKVLPVPDLMADNSALFMWSTAPHLEHAFTLIRYWGLRYSSMGGWHKKTKHGKTQFGTGRVFRSAMEPYIVAMKGKPPIRARNVRNIMEEKVREHSRKPDKQYADVEALFEGPYLEMFSRTSWPGWDVWGNEVGKFD